MRIQYVIGMIETEEVHKAYLQRALDLTGFRLDEFVPALYEVTPWSWLIDYFSNVGGLLAASTVDTSDIAWISRTVSRRSLDDRSVTSPTDAHLIQFFNANGAIQFVGQSAGGLGHSLLSRTTVERKNIAKLPIPRLEFKHPALLSLKSLNIAAIIAQRRDLGDLSWLTRKGA